MGLFSKPLGTPGVIERSGTTREIFPWEWPGPIAPAGMRAVKQAGNTFSHVTDLSPEYQSEDAGAEDYQKVVQWAERMHWSPPMVAAHWGTLVSRGEGPLYTKPMLIALQERIAQICKDNHEGKIEWDSLTRKRKERQPRQKSLNN